jgi:hypothetical protein
MCKAKVLLLAALWVTGAAVAQKSPTQPIQRSGLYEYTSFSVGHDSSAGWSSVMDSALGYSFNQSFAIEAGAPFYLLTTTQGTSTTGSTTGTTTFTGSLGDAFLRLKAQRKSDTLDYSTAFTVTAPTGDTSAGVSTGRATFNWGNRLEHGFDHVTPFGEASIGNSLASTRSHPRDYTTLGAVSEFRGGAGFDLLKHVSLETSAYADVGYGNQKVYSRSVRKGAVGPANAGKNNRGYAAAYLTTGAAGLVNDQGLSADLSWNITPRFDMGVSYDHSLHFATDSVAMTVGVRLGGGATKPAK